jgi:YbbR domain-containing protein
MIPRPKDPIPFRRRLTAMFSERLALKSLSVLLALVLWFVVAAREPREEYAPVRFAPRLDSALVLRDPAPPIRAHVLGRPSEILKLANAPLTIRREIAGDAPDTLVIALRASDVEVPEGIEVIVREVYPDAVTLRFEPSTSRRVPVRSAILARNPLDLAVGNVGVLVEPESVTVSGPRRMVGHLAFVRTVADSISVDTLAHLVDLDTSGLGATVRPAQVKVRFIRMRP